ncbi:hypothetical protein MAR_004057, partial [Mya arenaria]
MKLLQNFSINYHSPSLSHYPELIVITGGGHCCELVGGCPSVLDLGAACEFHYILDIALLNQIKATANLSLLETEHKQNICQEAMCSQAVNNETFVGVLYDKDVDLNQKHPPKKQDKADKKQLHSASNHEVHIPHENIQNLRETKTPNTSVCDTNEQIGNEGEFNEILRAVSLQNTNDNSVDKSKDQGKKYDVVNGKNMGHYVPGLQHGIVYAKTRDRRVLGLQHAVHYAKIRD